MTVDEVLDGKTICNRCLGTGTLLEVKPDKSGYVTIVRSCTCPSGTALALKKGWIS